MSGYARISNHVSVQHSRNMLTTVTTYWQNSDRNDPPTCEQLLRVHLQASTGFGADTVGNAYGGGPDMTLEEAIDLAESEVQGIVSLVNVLYTDQVRAASRPHAKGEQVK